MPPAIADQAAFCRANALLTPGPERPPLPVAYAVLWLVARQLADGRRSFRDTRPVLVQVRQGLTLPPEATETLKQFELEGMREDHAAHPDRLRGPGAHVLAPFAAAATPFLHA